MQKEFVLVIPARYASTRLPGKPLVDIEGTPMIQRVFEQCLKAVPRELVYIATDSDEIKGVVEKFGAQCILTSESCLTGTDRVAEVAKQIPADFYINVQGDEPLFNPEDIRICINACRAYPNEVINGYAPLTNSNDFFSRSVPKVVFRNDGRLLYMSRSPIPGNKLDEYHFGYRQICAYGFPQEALLDFADGNEKSRFEEEEDIEILRFLERGYEVRMVPMSAESIPVDHPADVKRVIEKLNE